MHTYPCQAYFMFLLSLNSLNINVYKFLIFQFFMIRIHSNIMFQSNFWLFIYKNCRQVCLLFPSCYSFFITKYWYVYLTTDLMLYFKDRHVDDNLVLNQHPSRNVFSYAYEIGCKKINEARNPN